MESKAFYLSKTFWTNIIAIIGLVTADKLDFEISALLAGQILGIINIVLRFITKQEITWT